ncbi:Uncharacterized protein HZ326_27843 [Fusarium oxysporum f. sp. albedinis]|nr:Uncharacterized protein HZ326_27843 [Fusarium oxysporum f. sp. albedinis]
MGEERRSEKMLARCAYAAHFPDAHARSLRPSVWPRRRTMEFDCISHERDALAHRHQRRQRRLVSPSVGYSAPGSVGSIPTLLLRQLCHLRISVPTIPSWHWDDAVDWGRGPLPSWVPAVT